MMDYFVSLLLKAAESFLITLASRLAERLAAPKETDYSDRGCELIIQ